MTSSPKISVCIPAYKRIDYLQRLLRSIASQTFTDYEVIITDDSPDDSVRDYLQEKTSIPSLNYFRNESPLGTPENWNEAIRRAKGEWIKLMHDDDWFANDNALRVFYEGTRQSDAKFFFSAYTNEWESGKREEVRLSTFNRWLLKINPLNIFKFNFIGNPSCTLAKRDAGIFYDSTLKWVVDFEYYIRFLSAHKKAIYIDQPLVNVGMNQYQVTEYTFRKPEVEIPENHQMLEKFGSNILKNVFVYDHFWRLYRNLAIRSTDDINKHYSVGDTFALRRMLNFQKKIAPNLLKRGVFSKSLMLLSYVRDRMLRK